jgi:thiamine biosynthesis lipoprotein
VENDVAAATIIAPTCTFADGLATAVMVMGLEKSFGLINRLKGVEGVITTRTPDGELANHYSSGLAPR